MNDSKVTPAKAAPSEITLANGVNTAVIDLAAGATVRELQLIGQDGVARELLYQPKTLTPPWPGGGMPLLFPFAGRVWHGGKQGFYDPGDGKIRMMPIHGFAYAEQWLLRRRTSSGLLATLLSSEATEELYPFSFRLDYEIEVGVGRLDLKLTVYHDGESDALPMPVAAGFHPYFRVPFAADQASRQTWSDYQLDIPCQSLIQVTSAGEAGRETRMPPAKRFPLDDPSWHNLIAANLTASKASICHRPSHQAITLEWSAGSKIEHCVLWGKPDAGFFCLEPWQGLPDAIHTKKGLSFLKPGESQAIELSISTQST